MYWMSLKSGWVEGVQVNWPRPDKHAETERENKQGTSKNYKGEVNHRNTGNEGEAQFVQNNIERSFVKVHPIPAL